MALKLIKSHFIKTLHSKQIPPLTNQSRTILEYAEDDLFEPKLIEKYFLKKSLKKETKTIFLRTQKKNTAFATILHVILS